jgi:fucose 4-O-acetylase-like acetyltransferase
MKERQVDLDLLKGFGIIIVVAVHSNMPQHVTAFFQTFGMPLFFMLAGYTFNSNKYSENFFLLMKNRSVSLLIPYIMGCLISYVYWLITKFTGDYKESFVWYEPLLGIFKGNIEGILNYPLWFLVCLYGSLLIFAISQKYLQHFEIRLQFIFYACLGWAGSVIGSEFHLLWGLDISLVALLFIFIGSCIRKEKRFPGIIGLSLLLGAAFLLNKNVSMGLREYGNILLFYMGGISGSLLCLELVRRITVKQHWFTVISYIGRECIYILILHAGISFIIVSYANHYLFGKIVFHWSVYLLGGVVISLMIRYLVKKSTHFSWQLRKNKQLPKSKKSIA